MLLQNALLYKGKIYRSTHRHHTVYTDDGLVCIGGGNDYIKIGDYIDVCPRI